MASRTTVYAVVDPNVLISAVTSRAHPSRPPRHILDAWHAGLFEMLVSYDLLYELESVMLRPYFLSKITYSDVLEYVLWIREGSQMVETPEGVEAEVSDDPDDNYLYALALAFDAYLVSGDRHLLQLAGGPVRVVNPRTFLGVLGLKV